MNESMPVRRWLPASLLSALILSACGGGSQSGTSDLLADAQVTTALTADQQVPSLNLDASSGTSTLSIDADTGALSGVVTVSGLSSAARMAHIHKGAAGTNGPVLIALNIDESGMNFSVPVGSALDAAGIDNYLNGELYINVHTDDFPAGEIRSQLIPVDAEGRTRFSVQISNVSTESTLSTPSTGGTVAVPLSPGAYLVHSDSINPFVRRGIESSDALKALAETGNASFLRAAIPGSGTFDTPDGAFIPRAIDSGESYTFTITAEPGDKISLLSMFVQSNDWFYTTHNEEGGIALFSEDGAPLSGDVSDSLSLWESDTEEDQEPGTGSGQALRQTEEDSGPETDNGAVNSLAEKGKLESVNSVLNGDVINITITPVP